MHWKWTFATGGQPSVLQLWRSLQQIVQNWSVSACLSAWSSATRMSGSSRACSQTCRKLTSAVWRWELIFIILTGWQSFYFILISANHRQFSQCGLQHLSLGSDHSNRRQADSLQHVQQQDGWPPVCLQSNIGELQTAMFPQVFFNSVVNIHSYFFLSCWSN